MKKNTGFAIGAGTRNDAAQFKPGVSGNKKGRPPGKTIATILAELLEKHAPKDIQSAKFVEQFIRGKAGKRKVSNKEALVARLLSRAINGGHLPAIIEIFNRAEGVIDGPKDTNITVIVNGTERGKVVQDEIDKLG